MEISDNTYFSSVLPSAADHGQNLTVRVLVFDDLDAFTKSDTSVHLLQAVLDPVQLQLQLDSSVQSGTSSSTSLQTGVMITEALTKVDCSAAPDCVELNRYACSNIENSCGECIEGYLGETGQVNSLCIKIDDIQEQDYNNGYNFRT
mgnify:CR=1 FL=1